MITPAITSFNGYVTTAVPTFRLDGTYRGEATSPPFTLMRAEHATTGPLADGSHTLIVQPFGPQATSTDVFPVRNGPGH